MRKFICSKDNLMGSINHRIEDQGLKYDNGLKDNYHHDEKMIRQTKPKEIQRSRKLLKKYTEQLEQYKKIESKYHLLWHNIMKIVKPTFLKPGK